MTATPEMGTAELAGLNHGIAVPEQITGDALGTVGQVSPGPITRNDVLQYVRPEHLTVEDVQLLMRLAAIARADGSAVMRSMGLAARDPDEIEHTLHQQDELAERERLPQAVVDALRAALEVRTSALEQRLEPNATARAELLAQPRYHALLRLNHFANATTRPTTRLEAVDDTHVREISKPAVDADRIASFRVVKYYAIGRIAGMIATHGTRTTAVQ